MQGSRRSRITSYNVCYTKLLRSRYGKNPEFRGDPFGTLKVWKWNVEGPGGVRASLILENYTGDA